MSQDKVDNLLAALGAASLAKAIPGLQKALGAGQPIRLPQGPIEAQVLRKLCLQVVGSYSSKLEACSISQLFKAAEPLSAVIASCMVVWDLSPTSADWPPAKKVQLGFWAAETGTLTGLAKAACRLTAVVQQQLKGISKQHMQDMLQLVFCVGRLISLLSDKWPQDWLMVKAFEPVLVPWVELLLQVPAFDAAAKRCGSPQAGPPPSREAIRVQLADTSCVAFAVCNVDVDSSGLPIRLTDAVRSLYTSDSLLKLLELNFAWVLEAKYMQAKGLSSVLAVSCSKPTSSSTGNKMAASAALLHVPPYHKQLLDSLGLSEAGSIAIGSSMGADTDKRTWSDTYAAASEALMCIKFYRQESGVSGVPHNLRFDVKQLPLRFGTSSLGSSCHTSGRVRNCSLPAISNSDSATHTTASSTPGTKQHSELCVLLAMIQWIALEPEGDAASISGLLQHLHVGTLSLLITSAENDHTLPAELAAALLQPVLTVLTPAVLHLLRGSSATDGLQRRFMLMYYSQLITFLVMQGHSEDLAAVMSQDPLTAAVALEAAVRAHLECDNLRAELRRQAELQPVAPGMAGHATQLSSFTYRVVLAIHQLCRQWALQPDNCCNAAAAGNMDVGVTALQQPLPGALASLLTTGLKVGTAAAAVWADSSFGDSPCTQDISDLLGSWAQLLNQAVLTAQLGCFLGSFSATSRQQQQQRQGTPAGCVASSSSSGASYSISNSSSLGPPCQWMVLIARSLLLISTAVDHGLRRVGETMVTSGKSARLLCNFMVLAAPLQQVLAISLTALDWMKHQLEDLRNVSSTAAGGYLGTPAAAVGSTVSSSSRSGHADWLDLLKQQAVCDAALRALLPSLEAIDDLVQAGRDRGDSQRLFATKAGGPVYAIDIGEVFNMAGLVDNVQQILKDSAGWQRLSECASAVCHALPVSSSCNNLECVNFDKLSEQHLVGGKGCVCAGCGVARYCSKDCQEQHWKHHKVICKKLQGASAAAAGPAT